MKKENSAPTMKDVAREAGVALGTVSKVVNGLPVGESYRLRVEDAIRKLNYQVNSLTSPFLLPTRLRRWWMIALLLPENFRSIFTMDSKGRKLTAVW